MTSIEFIHHFTLGGISYRPGDVAEVSDNDAERLVAAYRAIYTDAPPTPINQDPYPQYAMDSDLLGAVAGFLVAGANVNLTHDPALGILTIEAVGGAAGSTDPEVVRDTIATALRGTGGVSVSSDDVANTITVTVDAVSISQVTDLQATLETKADNGHGHTAADVSDFGETVQDAVNSLLVAGSNVTLTYDDAAGTLTIDAAGGGTGGTTDPEVVRDTIATSLAGAGGITVTSDDAANTITITLNAVTIDQVTDLQATLDGKQDEGAPIEQPRTDADAVPSWTTRTTGDLSAQVVNIAEHYVPMRAGVAVAEFLASWRNEWGAIRGTSPFTDGDALVRAIREDGDGIVGGGLAFHLNDRRTGAATPHMWGRRWEDGRLVRNGIIHNDVLVLDNAEAIPANTPAGTVILRRPA